MIRNETKATWLVLMALGVAGCSGDTNTTVVYVTRDGGSAGSGSGGRNMGGQGGSGAGTGGAGSGGQGAGGRALADAGPPRPSLGTACEQDRDCGGAGLTCLTSTSNAFSGGGPANGICTLDCAPDNTVCRRLDPDAVCVRLTQNTSPAFCLQGCTIGPTANPDKCHGRGDMACDDTASNIPGSGFCSPTCHNDADCGARKCDLGTGVCRDASAIRGTLDIGSNCDPNLVTDPCKGFCLPSSQADAGAGLGWCTGLCTVGQLGCGSTADSVPAPEAACLFALSNATDLGDIGLCGQLCDCNDDCKTTGRVCRPFPATEAAAYGRAGYCGGAIDRTTGGPAANIACAP